MAFPKIKSDSTGTMELSWNSAWFYPSPPKIPKSNTVYTKKIPSGGG
jgi:hypothetical protein